MMRFPCSKLLLIRPSGFGSNPDTIATNAFQSQASEEARIISQKARAEFDGMYQKLQSQGFDTLLLKEPEEEPLPDSVFPNNWFSTHPDKKLILYPMLSEFRRRERRTAFIDAIRESGNYRPVVDLSKYEKDALFLEGTGSVVFDHTAKKAFCAASPRNHGYLFEKLCEELEYRAIFFHTADSKGIPVYHTNVLMAIGRNSAIICTKVIREKETVLENLSQKEIIEISESQMTSFCGNVLLVSNKKGRTFWLMSNTAEASLNAKQKQALSNEGEILSFHIPTIEKYGGGSVRCMLAELF